MITEIVVVAPIIKKVPKNIYQIKFPFMHGDADLTTHATIRIREQGVRHVIEIVNIFERWDASDWNLRCDTTARDTKHYQTYALPGEEVGLNMLTDIIPVDAHYGYDSYAWPETPTVTYFDENGVEHSVAFKTDNQ